MQIVHTAVVSSPVCECCLLSAPYDATLLEYNYKAYHTHSSKLGFPGTLIYVALQESPGRIRLVGNAIDEWFQPRHLWMWTPRYLEELTSSNLMIVGEGAHLYFGVNIFLVKILSKHTLSTYFPRIKIHPNYASLHDFFFFIFPSPLQIFSNDKNTPFFLILHNFTLLNDVRTYIVRSWKTTLITWFFFYEDDIQL